jgi:Flp pilus assembly protein TadD
MDAEREEGRSMPAPDSSPGGDVYDWYRRGLDLLKSGSPEAAAQLLVHAAAAQPHSRSILEALARAQFDAGRYAEAADTFRGIVEDDPADHYARYGLGMASMRIGNVEAAVEQLALAAAMRPDQQHYVSALSGARATLRSRRRTRDQR